MSVPYNAWGLGLAPGTPHGHLPLTRYERQSPPQISGPPHSQPVAASTNNAPLSESVHLEIRQQPKEALLTSEGKEKARKPVDPPPIIQLKVDGQADPPQHFLQSPYLFMCVTLWDARKNQPVSQDGKPVLAGSLVSSLHRLKDVDNRDGGFFVFGDVSVKVQGTHRLHFSLFDLHKDTLEVVFLKSITSEPFRVVLPKDFKGMDESTYLSRAFSDQGVRLRLRKEPRAMMGSGAKRAYAYGPPDTISGDSHHDEGHSTPKRQRTYADSDEGEGPRGWDSRGPYGERQMSHAPNYQSIPGQPMMPYQQTGYSVGGGRPDYLRTPSTSYSTDPLTSTLSGLSRYPEIQSPYQPYGNAYSNVIRPSLTSTSFRDDISEDRYRTGSQSQPLSSGFPQTPTHSSHDSMGSSRGPNFSQSPEASRTTYPQGSNSFSLPNLPTTQSGAPASLATGYRPPGRYEERVESAFAELSKRHQQHDLGLAIPGTGGELPHPSMNSFAPTPMSSQQHSPHHLESVELHGDFRQE